MAATARRHISTFGTCGSGHVEEFRARQDAQLQLRGSGNIRVSVERGATVEKTKIGSGDIRVREVSSEVPLL